MNIRKLICLCMAFSLLSYSIVALAEEDSDALMPISEVSTEALTEAASEEMSEAESEVVFEEPTEYETEASTEEVEYNPFTSPVVSPEWLNLYVDNKLAAMNNRIMYINGVLCVPAEETAQKLYIQTSLTAFSETSIALSLQYKDFSCHIFPNSYYAIINGVALNLKNPCYSINGVLYVPLDVIADVFNDVKPEITQQYADKDVFITSYYEAIVSEQNFEYSERVKNITSTTDYLIWVNKAEFKVRLFKKTAVGWSFQSEYPCAIGAPGTPTCEGTFKYYERVAAWRYSTYYVGPIMRFNGGYALHSTLQNYDGTAKNDSVGVRISHGCVRLHPADINYLVDNVPLYTTVYVTAN